MERSDKLVPENYYTVLGLCSDSSAQDIRRAYRKLAMQWHPDKWSKSPELCGVAKRKFQQIQEAYSVLSDSKKRKMYDAGLYDPDDEVDEGFADFVEEMASLIDKTRREEHGTKKSHEVCVGSISKKGNSEEVVKSKLQKVKSMCPVDLALLCVTAFDAVASGLSHLLQRGSE